MLRKYFVGKFSRDQTGAQKGQRKELCEICLKEFQKESAVLTHPGCGHTFHYDTCVKEWIYNKKRCPICGVSTWHKLFEHIIRHRQDTNIPKPHVTESKNQKRLHGIDRPDLEEKLLAQTVISSGDISDKKSSTSSDDPTTHNSKTVILDLKL